MLRSLTVAATGAALGAWDVCDDAPDGMRAKATVRSGTCTWQ